ncbi:ankyrin repeat-containing protein [Aspergillus bombycis]|uniref:Ankyrin repeat-containing protein n=1 Tax=Aspergillus bombycis TaxID=109264 RepID=A0A1F8A438_9EURO|nr:ankyrin repeat-containing protein [Aspergillus bombycis]OGM46481.1 ankyrin repeat-containing protein [Aspergillus bombycis]
MRLLNTTPSDTGNFTIEEFFGEPPPYAILSHTWHEMEVTFQDITTGITDKKGFKKVKDCCTFARANGYGYAWIDTCCIDKTSSAELSESLNSMYRWYQEAEVCYAYLPDVPSKPLAESRWFTRGWTLQELIAPSSVIFLDHDWNELGTRESLRDALSEITSIPVGILTGEDDVETASVAQRMSWAARRVTTRVEDRAYCLMGIFGINMPPIYGEGKNAFIRLQEEIMKILDDHSIFAWRSDSEDENHGGLLATSPDAFRDSANIVPYSPFTTADGPLTISSKGIHLELRFIGVGHPGLGLGILHCAESDASGRNRLIAIHMQDVFLTMQHFQRLHCGGFIHLTLEDLKPSQYPLRRICVKQRRPATRKVAKDRKVQDTVTTIDNLQLQILANPLQVCCDTEKNWINANGIDGKGQVLLSRAAEKGHAEMLWLLLTRSDVRPNGRDINGHTPLSRAAECGQEAIVKLLLARNDVEPDLGDEIGRTPLSYAAASGGLAVVRLLLQSGKVYADSRDKFGRTPLSRAAESGHNPVVKLLLAKGVDVDAKDEQRGLTPLSWAATKNDHDAVVGLLLDNGADIESKDSSDRTPLSLAAREGREAVVAFLLKKGADIESHDNISYTPLLWAAFRGQRATAKLLLENGASIECRENRRQTPLAVAAERGHEATMRVLVEYGANIDSLDIIKETPLLLAVKRGCEAAVKLLLEKGANIEARDRVLRTPLFIAVDEGHEAVAKLLLDKGADTRCQDNLRRTPLSLAAEKNLVTLVKLLQDMGTHAGTVDQDRR